MRPIAPSCPRCRTGRVSVLLDEDWELEFAICTGCGVSVNFDLMYSKDHFSPSEVVRIEREAQENYDAFIRIINRTISEDECEDP